MIISNRVITHTFSNRVYLHDVIDNKCLKWYYEFSNELSTIPLKTVK